MNRKVLAGIIAAAVFLSALGVCVAAFTSIGRPGDYCPPMRTPSQPINNSFTILAVGNRSEGYSGSGAISWCIYGRSGHLEKSYQTNRILTGVAYSANGEYVAAAGYKVAPGLAGASVNGSVYLFNKNGQMKWSVSTPEPIFAVDINGNGSAIMTSDSVLLYINNQGKVLWNYSKYGPTVGALVNNGSKVIAGISFIPFPNHSSYGSSLTMFDANGSVLWNVSLPDQLFDSTSSLALSGGHIAAGLTNTGYNGTLNYYNMQGKLIWSRDVDSAILGVSFTSNRSAILVETNWGHDTFDLSGNVIQNQTAPHSID